MRTRSAMCSVALLLAISGCGSDDGAGTETTVAQETPPSEPAGDDAADDGDGADATGGDTTEVSDAASDGAISVCPLLTDDEVASVLGTTAPGEEDAMLAPLYSCEWSTAESPELTLSVVWRANPAEVEALFDPAATEGSVAVDGLGDAARMRPYFGDGYELEILNGSYWLALSSTALGAGEELIPLAEAVLTRLP